MKEATEKNRATGETRGDGSSPRLWRSLEERANSEDVRAFEERANEDVRALLEAEVPGAVSGWIDAPDRRRFLQLMGASMALAGVTACTRQPEEAIVPYVRQPEEIVPGVPNRYATATVLDGVATGVLVESHEGRPTKIEGNPEHPGSLGATDALMQGEVLRLYDPDRVRVTTDRGQIRPWGVFTEALAAAMIKQKASAGAGLRILTPVTTSPSLAAEIRKLLGVYPEAKWHQYAAVSRDQSMAGARLAFGRPAHTYYDVAHADVIISLDADFLGQGVGAVRYAREFARRRRPQERDQMNRLYVAESVPSVTGSVADHRLPLRATRVEAFARALARELGLAVDAEEAAYDSWVRALGRDLRRHKGASLVVVGESQPPIVHALAHAMNERLENVGRTVHYTDPLEAAPVDALESLSELVRDIDDGAVETLVILGGNPVYDAPADFELEERIQKVPLRFRLGYHDDETSVLCHWVVPEAHPFETWSDARGFDGTITVLQPLIAPLHGGRSPLEILAALLGDPTKTAHEIVQSYWREKRKGADFERWWRRTLHDGVMADSALPRIRPEVTIDWSAHKRRDRSVGSYDLVFRPDPTIWDGLHSNNGWLQELSKPLTKLTWDNVAAMSPALAASLGVTTGDVIELILDRRTISAPVWVQPGHGPATVSVTLGYGRRRVGKIGNGVGFNANDVRTSDEPWIATSLGVRPRGERYPLATTQQHHSMEGRGLVRSASLEHYRDHPDFAQHVGHHTPDDDMTLFAPWKYEGHAWAMTIDLNTCTGCGACEIACQAENNIAVVGKTEVSRGREMHWIRIDRYYEGDPENPTVHHQPVPCMHCENAPCELVCPVAATAHSDEGLNDMVYNRCVGTRYCSNNCPYKVRRFNFFGYSDWNTETTKLQRNPDVTVRSRGVMEKCTYCVQRINGARIRARREGREIRDGEIVTACQQACPSEAITFGDRNDPESAVAKAKRDPRNYGILEELNTRPRTTYLARLTNPNLELEDAIETHVDDEHHG